MSKACRWSPEEGNCDKVEPLIYIRIGFVQSLLSLFSLITSGEKNNESNGFMGLTVKLDQCEEEFSDELNSLLKSSLKYGS